MCTAIAEPPQRVVGRVGLGVFGRGCRVRAFVRLRVLIDMGAACISTAVVHDRVLRARASLTTAGRRDARHFARLRKGVAKIGAGRFYIGADTLGSN